MTRIALFSVVLLTLTCLASRAQVPQLVKDIRTNGPNPSSRPANFFRAGNWTYFTAQHTDSGVELYRTGGTTGSTLLLRDIRPGKNSSHPRPLAAVGSSLLFTATEDKTGRELWISDGTAQGTRLFLDVEPGPGSSNPSLVGSVGNVVYLSLSDTKHGRELWRCDGTVRGTQLVADIAPGNADSNFTGLATFGAHLYGYASTPATGLELFRTDGTASGTQLVKDIRSGAQDAFGLGSSAVVVGSSLYFSADDGQVGRELWKTDGTAAGTTLVKDIWPGASSGSPASMRTLGSKLLFTAAGGPAARLTDNELWISDGTAAGTRELIDLSANFGSFPQQLTVFGKHLYFLAVGVLYRTDGTTAGTLRFGPNGGTRSIARIGNRLWLSASTSSILADYEPWISDGTSAGTRLVKDLWPGTSSSDPKFFAATTNGVVFQATDLQRGVELFASDGTSVGTQLIADVDSGAGHSLGSDPRGFTDVPGRTFFSADDGVTGRELWVTDQTTGGTRLVKDIRAGREGSNPTEITALGSIVLFRADDGASGSELWRSDGTAAGTFLVHDAWSGGTSGSPAALTAFGAHVYYGATDDKLGRELFRSDGTVSGTKLVKEIGPGPGGSGPRFMRQVGARLFFTFHAAGTGEELYVTDGSISGTRLVKDIYPGAQSSSIRQIVDIQGVAYFGAYEPIAGLELWRSDGTDMGTRLVADLVPGSQSSLPTGLAVVGDKVVFAATDASTGNELYVSDGTANGTVRLLDIYPGPTSSGPREMTAFRDRVWFAASTGSGFALFETDGTPTGTKRVASLAGLYALGIYGLTACGDRALFFTAIEVLRGPTLWSSDGTASGTGPVSGIGAGSIGSGSSWRTIAQGALLFDGDDGRSGKELWRYVPGASAVPVGVGCTTTGSLPTLQASDPVIGKPFALRGSNAIAPSVGILFLSPPPSQTFVFLRDCRAHIDFAGSFFSHAFVAHSTNWTLGWTTPQDATLAGVRIQAQVFGFGTSFPHDLVTTNGLAIRIDTQ